MVLAATLATLLAFVRPGSANAAEPAVQHSSRVSLLELYTSEGCNSCPPTDRWVSNLPRPRLVPEKLVVLAYHVDYWNYLGWQDRFSQRRFSERQEELVRSTDLSTAYTPQLILNGRDYRDRDDLETRIAQIDAQPPSVRLRLDAQRHGDTLQLTAHVEPLAQGTDRLSLYVAVFENNLETDVKAGENRGRRLRHDYVVRRLIGPTALAHDKPVQWEADIPLARDWKRTDLGVAAFVENRRTREVLQATARPL
jgi:hypothetical protein